MSSTASYRRASASRWATAAEVLALLARQPGITRAEVARRLSLSSGSATEITARLRELRLVSEVPAHTARRGRPTTVLRHHPGGPIVVALEVRHEDWRCLAAAVDGQLQWLAGQRHSGGDPGAVLDALRAAVTNAVERFGHRVRVVSMAVPATVTDNEIRQASSLGWGRVELARVAAAVGDPRNVAVLVGNDATLAAIAEARTGAAVAAQTVLHLIVEVGVGGALVVGERPITGASGAAGEYGHLPLGDTRLQCPCGARGCWDLEVDGRAMARHLGVDDPIDPRSYARDVLLRSERERAARAAVKRVARALGRGTAGLVNAHDPDIVTIGGLAIPIRAAAAEEFQEAYLGGLMAFRRTHPTPVVDAAHGDDGPIRGAVAVGLDQLISVPGLAGWAQFTAKT
jgi:predicted NBD/HSP70 family sugar kinase